jgi:hypothetical protein
MIRYKSETEKYGLRLFYLRPWNFDQGCNEIEEHVLDTNAVKQLPEAATDV